MIYRVFFILLCSLLFCGSSFAQSHSQFFDYIGLNAYWNGTAWTSYASGYGSMFTTDSATGDFALYSTGNAASAGLARTLSPVLAVTAAGTVSATRFVGDGSGLTGVVASTGDRIVSSTTSMVADGASGLISITQAGTNTAYFHPQLGLVTVGVSSTGAISATNGYFGGYVNITGGLDIGGGSVRTISRVRSIINDEAAGLAIATISSVNNAGPIIFKPSNTEAMRIVSSGYVGIGTSNPNANLHIANGSSTAKLRLDAWQSNLLLYSTKPDGTEHNTIDFYRSHGSYAALPDGYAMGEIRSFGSDGSGYSQGSGILFKIDGTVISGSSVFPSGIDFQSRNSAWQYPITTMRLSSNGWLGVGFGLYPSATLHVGGNGMVTQKLYVGGTVTPTTSLEVSGTVSATNIQTAGTFRVGSYSSAPVTCSASYKGMFAMNSADNLCLCNGTSWVGVGTGGTACAW